ncbi:MAG TPA: hypothetical protein VGL72_22140 [Bryobacteraceae bacterium]|jgi:hypothetical protein
MIRTAISLLNFRQASFWMIASVYFVLAASAHTVEVTSTNNTLGENTYLLENGVDTATYAGEGNILLDGTINRTAFCVAIFVDINIGVLYNTVLTDISSITNGGRVGWLLDNILPSIITSSPTYGSTAQQGAGLQMAIWDIVNDNGDGFSAGGVQSSINTDPIAVRAARYYESLSVGQSADAWVYMNFSQANNAPAQTLMGFVNLSDGGPVVPEPGTFGLVLPGFVLVAGGLLRSFKN